MSEWKSVDDELPEFDELVIVRYPSGFDGSDVYAWGGRVDENEDGWFWGVSQRYGGDILPSESAGWNDVEADDEYPVTHWMPLPKSPIAKP